MQSNARLIGDWESLVQLWEAKFDEIYLEACV